MKNLAVIGALIVLVFGFFYMRKPQLKYFKSTEFGIWWPLMSNDLLLKLDHFREVWGAPVMVSSAVGSIGRHGDDGNDSQHNVTKWGEVRAIDVFPMVGRGYMNSAEDLNRAHTLARHVGFTGIGLYTDTQPGYMLHVDVRKDRSTENPALWSRIDGEYLPIERVLA